MDIVKTGHCDMVLKYSLLFQIKIIVNFKFFPTRTSVFTCLLFHLGPKAKANSVWNVQEKHFFKAKQIIFRLYILQIRFKITIVIMCEVF